MGVKSGMLICSLTLLATSTACLASGGGAMGGGRMGGGSGMSDAAPQSPQDQAKVYYNQGVREVGKAKSHDDDAAKATDDKKAAKYSEKAQKSYASALEYFQKAVDNDPGLFQAWNYVGFCERHLGQYEDALDAYGKALELNPQYGEAYEYRAEAYLGLNRLDDAKASYIRLFSTARPLADELMTSMHRWVEQRQHDAKGVSAEDLAAFAQWVNERTAVAQQTASLWTDTASKKHIDWN